MLSRKRLICKRCHHLRPVDDAGYCESCTIDLRAQERRPAHAGGEGTVAGDPNTLPAANEMDAPGGPRCACGKPSVFENGSCSDCAVDGAQRVPKPTLLVGDSMGAATGLDVPSDPAAAGFSKVPEGEADPITERSSKIPTLPPVGGLADATFGTDNGPGETVLYVAKNGDPDLAVLVSPPAPPSPLLEGAAINVTSVSFSQEAHSDEEDEAARRCRG